MAFALSAAMMLTTMNMPAVTAWAQDDSEAGVAELAADEGDVQLGCISQHRD